MNGVGTIVDLPSDSRDPDSHKTIFYSPPIILGAEPTASPLRPDLSSYSVAPSSS